MTNDSGLTLTKAITQSKKVLKFTFIGIVVFVVGRFLLNASMRIYTALNPPPPPPPTVGFGKLPELDFSENTYVKAQEYRLETATGKLPEFPDRAKVFFIPEAAPSLLTDQAAKQTAASLGFTSEPKILDGRTYRWGKNAPLISTFTLDALSETFTLYTDFLSRPELLIDSQLPDDFAGVERVKAYLSDGGLLHPDVATASGSITYLKSLGNALEPALSYSDAEFMQIDLVRQPIDQQYQIVTPDGTKGTISAIISGALSGDESIVQLEFNHRQVDYLEVETYPLRDVKSAWQIVQANEAYVINPQEVTQAVIREVGLGYFDSFEPQSYLQPVYVFDGDNDLKVIVPAISPTYIERNPK